MRSSGAHSWSLKKSEGAGNDFLFYDAAQGIMSEAEVVAVCDRHFGVGADGVVAMEAVGPNASRWHFFNRDGSRAAMCGNAARAAAAWLASHANRGFPHALETEFGTITLNLEKLSGSMQFSATVPYRTKKLSEQALTGAKLIDTGVPHAVVEWPRSVLGTESDVKAMRETAAHYRWVREAGVGGANVTFYFKTSSPGMIEAITFERGVEEFTLSCGTGVLAAAVVSSRALTEGWPAGGVSVRNPGALLRVESSSFPSELKLIGPSRVVFATEWSMPVGAEASR